MDLIERTTQLFRITKGFAKRTNYPVLFAGQVLVQTPNAAYLYGHGTIESAKTGNCLRCGHSLTHPVSVILGIGPECGGHYHDWKTVGGYTHSNIARLKEEMTNILRNQKIDGWVPKGCIKGDPQEINETVDVPEDHPIFKRKDKPKVERRVSLKTYGGEQGRFLHITFPYNTEDLENIKSLKGRNFVKDKRQPYWTIPYSIGVVEALIYWGFTLDETLTSEKVIKDLAKKLEKAEKTQKVDIEMVRTKSANRLRRTKIKIKGLQTPLLPFQEGGVCLLEEKNGRALLADEMGLGKTCQSLAWTLLHPEKKPIIIVTPASLKLNWVAEIKKFLPPGQKVQVLYGRKTEPVTGEFILINYDILTYWIEELSLINAQVLITDECHFYKNPDAKRTKAVKRLAKGIPHFIPISGTPAENRPIELYNAINLVEPVPFWEYAHRYCAAKKINLPVKNKKGQKIVISKWDFSGATNTKELYRFLTDRIMIRRLRANVMPELPKKIRSIVPIELTKKSQEVYDTVEADFLVWLAETRGEKAAKKARNAEALTKIESLKQVALQGKMDKAINWIEDFMDSGEKLVVFTTHTKAINTLMRQFGDIAVRIDGSVRTSDRQALVDKFQEDPTCRLFVGNLKAAGVGFNLTASYNVCFLEMGWTPGGLDQGEDRVCRIGQKADSVNIYYLIAHGTIEEKIAGMLDSKRKILDRILDGKVTETTSLLTDLLAKYEEAA